MSLIPGLSIVIPCFNEAGTIQVAVAEAFAGIRDSGLAGEVVVANNMSTDESPRLAREAGARVVDVTSPGYGAALDGGIRAARHEWVLFADADMSYPFLEAKQLLEPLQSGTADFVLGSRLRGTIEPGAMPFLNRRLGTPVLSWLIRLLYGLPASDCNSGMRAFSRSRYEALDLRCPGMEYASEMLVRVAQAKLRYQEVPLSFRKDRRGRAPHLRRWRDGWRHLRFILGNAEGDAWVTGPLLVSLALMTFAIGLSFEALWAPQSPIHYHSAFVAISLATPFLMLAFSVLLIRAALQGRIHSPWTQRLQAWSDTSVPFYVSAALFGLALVQVAILFVDWARLGFGELHELGAVIRIMVLTILATGLFTLDIGLGILKLVPNQAGEKRVAEF